MKRISILFSFIFIASVVQAQWSTTNLSEARFNMAATSASNKVFFAGGQTATDLSSRVDIFDLTTNTWMPTEELSVARIRLTGVTNGNKVFFAGGVSATGISGRVDIYDISNDQWSYYDLPTPRFGIHSATAGSKVIFAGGFVRSKVDIYDLSSNTWTHSDLPPGVDIDGDYNEKGVTVGTKVFFGSDQTIAVYDDATGSWSTMTLPTNRQNYAIAAVGTKVLFAGGDGGSTTMDIYDASTGMWSGGIFPGLENSQVATVGVKVFFCNTSVPVMNEVVNIYDANTSTWSTEIVANGGGQLSTLTSSGPKVFFAGGLSFTNSYSTLVELYTISPSITSFTPTTGAPGDAVTLTGNFDLTPANNTVTFNGVAATVTASSFTSLTATVPAGASTGPITISYGGFSASSTWSFNVTGRTNNTITFSAITDKTYVAPSANYNLTISASAGVVPPPFNIVSSDNSVATVAWNASTSKWVVTVVGAGDCTFTATHPGNATFRAAAPVTRSLHVIRANQTITSFGNLTKPYSTTNFTFNAGGPLPLTYGIENSNIAVLTNANTWHIVGVGVTNITASNSGNANYNPVTITRTLTVSKATPTITFNTIPAKTYDLGSYLLITTITTVPAGLSLTYSSSNTAVATTGGANGDYAIFTGVGNTTITASRDEDANFFAALPVQKTLTINKGVQTINFPSFSPVNSWDPDFNLTATATSGLPVTYSSSKPSVATVSDIDGDNIWTVDILAPGTTTITASQAGNALWSAVSPAVTQQLVVKALQTISFGALANKNYGDLPFNLSATASPSGLPVTFSTTDTNISINGTQVTILGPGTATITASQTGNSAYSPAPDVQQSFFIGLLAPTVSASFIEFTAVAETEMNIGFIPGNGNKRLVVIKPSDPNNFFTPLDNQFYSVGYSSNGSTVVMNGPGSLATVAGLVAGTKYYVKIFEFNEVGSFTSYLTGCEPNAAQTTLNSGGGAGSRVATNSAVSSTSEVPKKDYTIKPFDVKVFGNPFDKKLTFVVDSEQNDAIITLTDLTGRTVHTSTVITNTTVEIEKPMSQGVYLLKVKSGVDSKTIRVIKVSE